MPPARRFTLVDAMVLVAATAVGLGLAKGFDKELTSFIHVTFNQGWDPQIATAAGATLWVTALTLPCCMAWTAATLVLRLRHPHPTRRRLLRQPGLVACVVAPLPAVTAIVDRAIYCFLATYTDMNSPNRLPSPPFITHGRVASPAVRPDLHEELWSVIFANAPRHTVPCIGMTVAVAWIVLTMSGRYRPERSWIDRLGRALGVYWIAVGLLIGPLSDLAWHLK